MLPADYVSEQELATLEARAAAMRERLEAQLERLREIAERTGLGAAADTEALEAAVAIAERQLDAVRAEVMQAAASLPQRQQAQRRAAALEAEARELERQATRVTQQTAEAVDNPLLRYLPEAGSAKQPMLVLVSAEGLALGSADPAGSVLWFGADTATARTRQLLAALKPLDRRRFYCVVIIKPDAVDGVGESLMATLREQGFEVGMDLVTQDASLFAEPFP